MQSRCQIASFAESSKIPEFRCEARHFEADASQKTENGADRFPISEAQLTRPGSEHIIGHAGWPAAALLPRRLIERGARKCVAGVERTTEEKACRVSHG